MVEVRIAGVRFEEWPSNFGQCYLLARNGLRGWRGGDLRREELPRPAAHGAFDFNGYQAQKVISVTGTILASSEPALKHMKDTVLSILSRGGSGRMSVDEDSSSTWRDVRLVSCSDPEDLDELSATFSLTFWAADPRRYGEVRDYNAGIAAVHYGNFDANPRLLIGAGSGGYTVTGPGGRVVTVTTAPAAAHEIDFAAGGLYLAGVRQVGAISVYQPWTIAPGTPGAAATITGARSLTQRVTDTFL